MHHNEFYLEMIDLHTKVNYNDAYIFDNIPNNEIDNLKQKIRSIIKKYNSTCMVTESGSTITIRDITEFRGE